MEKTAEKGDTVVIEYTGKLESGEIFDSTKGKNPLEFELGSGKVIKGFDEGIFGMKIGSKKDIAINPKEGYGERNENYVKDLPKSSVPKELELKQGMLLIFKREDGMRIPAKVVEIGNETINVDFNHPLAGKVLKFQVKLIGIK